MRTFSTAYPGFTKVEVKAFVTIMLKTNVEWAKRACVVVFDNQLPSEQRNHISIDENDVGFSRFDAPRLSSIACKIKKRSTLSQNEVSLLLNRMPSYSVQVIEKADPLKMQKHLCQYYNRDAPNKPPF
jgi:hypothetical protein